jgi:hypothetical protein
MSTLTALETQAMFSEDLQINHGLARKDFLLSLRHVENVYSLVVYLAESAWNTRLPHKFNRMDVHKTPIKELIPSFKA